MYIRDKKICSSLGSRSSKGARRRRWEYEPRRFRQDWMSACQVRHSFSVSESLQLKNPSRQPEVGQ